MAGLVVGSSSSYVGEGEIGSGAVNTTLTPPLFTNANSTYAPVGAPVPPVIAGTASGSEATSTTSISIGLPSGIQAGDILVIFLQKTGGDPTFPAGWTVELGAGTPRFARAYRYCDGSEGSSITVTFTASTRKAWVVYLVRGADNNTISIAKNVNSFTGSSSPDPASVAVPATWQDSAAISFAAIGFQDATATISAWPTGYTESLVEITSGATAIDLRTAAAVVRHAAVGSAVDPVAFSLSSTADGHVDTLIIRAKSAGVRHAYKPGAVASSNAYFGAEVTFPAGGTKLPPLYTNAQAFYGPTVLRRIAPPLFTNTSSFFGPSVRRVAALASFSNGQTFFGPSVRLTVRASLFTNVNAPFAPTVTQTTFVQPPLYTNANTIFGPSARRTKAPSLFTNTNTIFGLSVRRTVAPALYTNGQTFYGPRIRLTVRLGGTVASGNVFFGPTIAADGAVSPPLYVNTNTFYDPVVGVTAQPAPPPSGGPGAIGGPGWLDDADPRRARPKKKQTTWPTLPPVEQIAKAPPWRLVVVTDQIAKAKGNAKALAAMSKAQEKARRARQRAAKIEKTIDEVTTNVVVRFIVDELGKRH